MTKTFAPPRPPSLSSSLSYERIGSTDEAAAGYSEARLDQVRLPRRWQLVWQAAPEHVTDWIVDFFERMAGRDEAFYWTPPVKRHSPLSEGPEVTTIISGTLGQNTYRIAFTWFAGALETLPSPYVEIFKGLNHVLRVTVPLWPETGIDGFRLYEQTLGRIAEENVGVTWTQSVALVAGPPAPTANTLYVPAKWRLEGDAPSLQPRGRGVYDVSLVLREQPY